MAGGAERVADEFANPITGEGRFLADLALEYDVTNADVGRPLRCEVTATNGAYAATRLSEGVVAPAPPAQKDPRGLLAELRFPADYVVFDSARRARPGRDEARAGALSKTVVQASRGVTADIDITALVFARPRQADAGVGPGFCRALRRNYRRDSTAAVPRQVLSCRRVRLPGARRAYAALAYGGGVSDLAPRSR